MEGLLTSVIHRPYVFVFLAAFLFLSHIRFGWRKALLWLVVAYFVAWASEISSITNGFPYGWYSYVYENMRGELLLAGVPFFDSLSYVFLTFAGFTTAEFIISWSAFTNEPTNQRTNARIVFLGALLTMLLDVIIDPIATMGERWFLGEIHTYANPGWYFGVPMTNFGGWFLVSFAIIGLNVLAWKVFPGFFHKRTNEPTNQRTKLLYPAFYSGIALFCISMSFSIGEWKLGITSSCWLAAILFFVIRSALKKKTARSSR